MNQERVVIYHTNDMHAHIEAMGRLSHLHRRRRTEDISRGYRTYLWDAGDAADRSEELCSLTKGETYYELLNAMGYQLQTVGNDLTLTYGPQVLEAISTRAHFPLLAANLRKGESGPLAPGVQETVILATDSGTRIGIIGVTDPWGGAYQIFGYDTPDTFLLVRKLVNQFRSMNVNIVILLSHLGLAEDRRLAQEVPGIDLIIGAHSHDTLPHGETIGSTTIAQAGEYATNLGRIDLIISTEDGKLLSVEASLIRVPVDEPQDPIFLEALERIRNELEEYENTTLVELNQGYEVDYFAECSLGDLAADALRNFMQTDCAVLSSGLLAKDLKPGTLTLGELNRACFTTANPYRSVIPGSQIEAVLERGLDPKITSLLPKSFRGSPVGILQISGLSVNAALYGLPGQKIKSVYLNRTPLSPEKLYTIAYTDAESSSNIGFIDPEQVSSTEVRVPTILPEVLRDYLQKQGTGLSLQRNRWTFVD